MGPAVPASPTGAAANLFASTLHVFAITFAFLPELEGLDQYSFIDLFVIISSLILPEEKEKEKEREPEEVGIKHSRRNHGRILIVDDEEDVTFFLKEALQEYGGYEVVTFNDPSLALSSFDNNDDKPSAYDLILLDIKMPKMDGFELYQELQKRIDGSATDSSISSSGDQGKIGKKTKICFMTAFEVYFEALKELFPDSYSSMCFIKKPSSAQDLIKRISKEI
jgi:CheY-like chemotaxis protein